MVSYFEKRNNFWTHSAPQSDILNHSFVNDIYVGGKKLTRNGHKKATFVSCKFWLSVFNYTSYFDISELDAIFEDMNKKITIRLESIKRIQNGQRGS